MTTLRDRDGVVHEQLALVDGTFTPMCIVRDRLDLQPAYSADSLGVFRMTCVRGIVGNMQRRYWGRRP